jgi:tetratricopeptide (TPR) repeat protein
MIATPDASTALICDAASAYSVLGDELRESGTASLADTSAVLAAYRKAIDLDERALMIDPHFLRALRSLSINRGKIGGVELETDPALALKDFQAALQHIDTLPQAERENLSVRRMRAILQRKEASALVQLGEYAKATDLFTEVAQIFQKNVAADAQDSRALADLRVVLNFEALGYETAADPALAVTGSDRRCNLVAAEKLWMQVLEIIDQAIKHDPVNEDMQISKADALLRLGTIHSILHTAADSAAMAKKGIAGLKELALKEEASSLILDMAASDLLMVEPASLRDPQFAVSCAERAVALNHRKTPSLLLTLAQAYRASGQTEKSRATASEALALLPAPQPGSAKPRIRKLLELQLEPGKS